MTLNDIKSMDDDFLYPDTVAKIIGCNPQSIRIQARENPDALGFPVSVQGTRTRIPRLAFISWVEGGMQK